MLNVVPTTLFFLEGYHLFAHCLILFGFRTIPLRDLAKIGNYFVIDALTVMASFIYTSSGFSLIHLQHYYYILTWNKSYWSKRVAFWSSLDWHSNGGTSHVLEWVGTAFDAATHGLMMYALSEYIGFYDYALCFALFAGTVRGILFSDKSSWANPKSMPGWVKKRCTALETDNK